MTVAGDVYQKAQKSEHIFILGLHKFHVRNLTREGPGILFVCDVTCTCCILLLHVTWGAVGCVVSQVSKKIFACGYLKSRRYFSLVFVMLAPEVNGKTHPRLFLGIIKELDFF
jgi:hypothetical protein